MKSKILKLVSINIFVFASMLLSLEVAARLFTKATFFGTSKNLFDITDSSYYRNCRSCKAISSGVEVTLDASGNRVPDGGINEHKDSLKKSTSSKSDIIFIGDSVGFGVGVPFEKTFQNLLSQQHQDVNFINMSVIGHSLNQHEKTAEEIVNHYSKPGNTDRLQKVFLIYCLNDIQWSISNSKILATDSADAGASTPQFGWVNFMRSNSVFSYLNETLRNKSKLYLFVKGEFTDPYKRYFVADLQPYKSSVFDKKILKLKTISKKLEKLNIPFTVIIVPYEYQLRNAALDPGLLLPQNRVKDFLAANTIDYVDLYVDFSTSPVADSKSFYLGYDPMHLSAIGHLAFYNAISNSI